MHHKIKVTVYAHTKRFLEAKFGEGPLRLYPGQAAFDFIKIDFLGQSYENTYSSKDKLDTMYVILSENQFKKYDKLKHERDIFRTIEDFFKVCLYEYVEAKRVPGHVSINDCFRKFLTKYNLNGEDINIEMLKKKYQRTRKKYRKTWLQSVPKCVPKSVPKTVPVGKFESD